VAAFDRNRWPPSVGIGGRFASDSAPKVRARVSLGSRMITAPVCWVRRATALSAGRLAPKSRKRHPPRELYGGTLGSAQLELGQAIGMNPTLGRPSLCRLIDYVCSDTTPLALLPKHQSSNGSDHRP
jgi:hypothetical protein